MRARVAVIIPCFNDGALVPQAVGSIQEREPVEMVIVDDGSSDATTVEVLAGLASDTIHVVHHEVNGGLSAARTTGLHNTEAPYVFPLDADDLVMPGVLATLADRLDAHPEAMACFGDYEVFGTSSFRRQVPLTIDPYRIAFRNELTATALYRRTMLEAVNAWEPVVAGAGGRDDFFEDWHLWMSLAERGAVGVHVGREKVVYRRRLHADRLTAAGEARRREQYRRLKERHPDLFGRLREHRRRSELPAVVKLLYPLVFGDRPRSPLEHRVKRFLELRRGG
ncbi:MAG TPA: glycosyltransferase family 2 protein [Solirubrobacteraceae bacterium]|nr:glycosyltransferase family 2 protein [Solirubrobacteraceae bacterium]